MAGLDQKIVEWPNTLRADFDAFDDLDNVLQGAGLGWHPDFAAPEKQEPFTGARITADEEAAARELYVALTRARDRLVLVLPPEPASPKTRPERMADLLRDRSGLDASMDGGGIAICGRSFSARVIEEPRDREFVADTPTAAAPVPGFGERRPFSRSGHSPWRQSPSSLVADPARALPALTHVELGAKVRGTDDVFDLATDRGSAWHQAFRVAIERPDLVSRLTKATGLDDTTIHEIQSQGESNRRWLLASGYDRLHLEMPVQVVSAGGSEINGIIDCLAESDDGYLILDHKSGPCPDPEARFAG